MVTSRSGASRVALLSVIGLIAVKVVVAVFTGSISISAQATDSLIDLFGISLTFFAVRMAVEPADEEHPFGHGKIEGIAAAVQSVLIFAAAGFIIYSAILKLIQGSEIEMTEAGIGVMLFSIVVSFFLSRFLFKTAKSTGSMSLEASAKNIAADVYSAAGVLIAMVIIRFTGLTILDPIIALGVSIFILKAAFEVGRKAVRELVDVRLPREEESIIINTINEHRDEIVGFHAIRSRKSGNQRFIDLHLVMPQNSSLEKAHAMCDQLESDIAARLPRTSVTIHVEPCNKECNRCSVTKCDIRE